MHKIIISLSLFLAIPALSQTAEDILDKASEVVLGQHKPNELTSMIIMGSMTLPQGISATMETRIKAGKKSRTKLEMQGMKIEQGCDGVRYFENNPMLGMRLLEGGELDKALDDADLLKNFDWRSTYPTYVLEGTEDLDGVEVYKLKLTNKSGIDQVNYYDAKTYLLLRTDLTVESQIGTMETKTYFKEYDKVEGFLLPKLMVTHAMSHQMNFAVASYQLNVDFPVNLFELPESLKETATP